MATKKSVDHSTGNTKAIVRVNWVFILALGALLLAFAVLSRMDTRVGGEIIQGSITPPQDWTPSASASKQDKSVYGLYLASQIARRDGDDTKAAEFLKQTLDKANVIPAPEGETGEGTETDAVTVDEAELIYEAMHGMLVAGRVDEAIALSKKLEAMPLVDDEPFHQRYPIAQMLHVVEAIHNGDVKAALAYAEKPAHLSGLPYVFQHMLFTITRAWLKAGESEYDAAIAILDGLKIKELDKFVAYHKGLIQALAARKQQTLDGFAVIYDASEMVPRRLAEVYVNLLRVFGEPEKAQKVMDQFWAQNQDIWLQPDEVNRYLANHKDKLIVATRNDGVAELFYGAASLLHQQGNPTVAFELLQMALYLKPDFAIAKMLLASFYEDARRYEEALQAYAAIDDASPFAFRARMEHAQMQAREGNDDAAIRQLEQLSAEQPESPLPWLHLGDIYRSDKRWEEAIVAYSKALERFDNIGPHFWPIYYMRGIAYERVGKWDNAEPDFLKALELNPQQPDVLNYLAYSWVDMGRNIEKAHDMLITAVSRRPYDGHIIDSVGWAYYRLGEYDKALEYLERAIEIMADDPVVNDHLGDIYWKLGREREALYQWERALQFGPEEEDRELIERKLKEQRLVEESN